MDTSALTVLYDGGCPLCRREIAHYQTLPALEPILWLDISGEAELPLGIGHAAAMAEFHVIDSEGRLHKGADGFIALWQALPYFRWLARFCLSLHLLPLLRWGYARFARWRFKRRCEEGVCRT